MLEMSVRCSQRVFTLWWCNKVKEHFGTHFKAMKMVCGKCEAQASGPKVH